MKKYRWIPGLLLITVALFTTAGAQEKPLAPFHGIEMNGTTDVQIKQGATHSWTSAGPEAEYDLKVEQGILKINKIKDKTQAPVQIMFTQVDYVANLGTGELFSSGNITAPFLELKSVGSGNIRLDLEVQELKVSSSGAGAISLSGKCDKADVSVSGAGDYEAAGLEAQQVRVKVSGAGNAVVNAKTLLDVRVSGAGDVHYLGDPAEKNIDISGAGSVQQTSEDGITKRVDKELGDININAHININETHDADTTRLNLGDRKIIIIEDKEEDKEPKDKESRSNIKHIWSGVELGMNGYATTQMQLDVDKPYSAFELDHARSIVVNINPFERNFSLYRNYIALTTGLGVQFNRYMFHRSVQLTPYNDSISDDMIPINYHKNMLKASYLTIPLLFEFNTNDDPEKSFHFAIGGQLGVRLGTRTKQVFSTFGSKTRLVLKDDFNLNPIQYGLTARIGYKKINLFANYNLNELFRSGEGPKLFAFQAGITLVPF